MGICPKHRLFSPEPKPLERSPIRLPYVGTTTTPMNEPVSLNDCERYPNSPLCPGGGSYFDPCGIIPGPIPDDFRKKCNECECCSYISYRFLGFPTPPTIVCERKNTPECQDNRLKPLPPIPGGPPDIPPLEPDDPSTPCGRNAAILRAESLNRFTESFKERTEIIQKDVEAFQANYGFAASDLVVRVKDGEWVAPRPNAPPSYLSAERLWQKAVFDCIYRISNTSDSFLELLRGDRQKGYLPNRVKVSTHTQINNPMDIVQRIFKKMGIFANRSRSFC